MSHALARLCNLLTRLDWPWRALIVFLLLLAGLQCARHGSETTRQIVRLEGEPITVTTKTTFWRGIGAGHSGVGIGRDYYSYRVTLDFPNGRRIRFATGAAKPYALWRLKGQLYFVGEGMRVEGTFLTARIEPDGTLVRISKKDLPAGDRPWNLLGETRVEQRSWERYYQERAP